MFRYICTNCNRKYTTEVESCIHCNNKLEKQQGTKFKVIATTKVNIPSITHPEVPYNIVLLKDEHGNIHPKKTLTDFNIGDNYIEEKTENEPKQGFFSRLFRRK